MGGADAGANNAALPEMSVKNYVKYGGGAGKSFGNITGYGDVYFISGGRLFRRQPCCCGQQQ